MDGILGIFYLLSFLLIFFSLYFQLKEFKLFQASGYYPLKYVKLYYFQYWVIKFIVFLAIWSLAKKIYEKTRGQSILIGDQITNSYHANETVATILAIIFILTMLLLVFKLISKKVFNAPIKKLFVYNAMLFLVIIVLDGILFVMLNFYFFD